MTIDYSKSRVYIIKNHNNGVVYIGSTTQTLSQRFRGHTYMLKDNACHRSQLFDDMKQYGSRTFYIELLEEVSCVDKNELHKIEGKYIKQYIENGVEVYNKVIAGRDKKTYVKDNEEKVKQFHKQYREQHKDKIAEHSKQYNEQHKDEKREYDMKYREQNKDKLSERHKQYYEQHKDEINTIRHEYYKENREEVLKSCKEYRDKNKDEINARKREYHTLNKDKINAKQREKITCECGSSVSRVHLSRHKESKKHQAWSDKQ